MYSFIVTVLLFSPITSTYQPHDIVLDYHQSYEDCQVLVQKNNFGYCSPEEG